MHFYDAELVGRGKHIITRLVGKTRTQRLKKARAKSGQTQQVKAMLRRLGL